MPTSKKQFEAVVKRHMKDAYFIALGLVGNHEDALDISQQAFIRVYCNLKHLDPKRKFFPWFYQILKNLCFDYLRKKRSRKVALENIEQQQIKINDRFVPDVLAEKNETKENLWNAIGRLTEKHREIIILRHFQHLSYNQIAQTMFCSKGTVMSRLYHARKNLKQILDSEKGG